MRDKLGTFGIIIFCLVLLIGVPAGCFYAYRWFNWKFGYGPMVEQRMQEHVEKYHATE